VPGVVLMSIIGCMIGNTKKISNMGLSGLLSKTVLKGLIFPC